MTAGRSSGRIEFIGAVLCGGASRRMGRDKSTLLLGDEPMAVRVADAMWGAGASRVWAQGGDAGALEASGLEVVPDDRPGEGPLAAVITILRRAGPETVALVEPCDLLAPEPAAMKATVMALAEHAAAMVAVPVDSDGRLQWAQAAWRGGALAGLEEAWDDGERSLHGAARRLHLCEVRGLSDAALADADAPSDLPDIGQP